MLREEYTEKLEIVEKEISALNEKLEKELWNDRKEWIEHFKKFSNITELDRNAVIQLIQSLKIFEKKQIEITFRYQSEYEETIKLLHSPRRLFDMARKSRKNTILNGNSVLKSNLTINTAFYIRLSVEDNKNKGNSIEHQQMLLKNFVAINPEFHVIKTYIEMKIA